MKFQNKIIQQFYEFFTLEYSFPQKILESIDCMMDTIQHCWIVYFLLLCECFIIGSFHNPMILFCHFISIVSIGILRLFLFKQYSFSSHFLFSFAFYWIIGFVTAFLFDVFTVYSYIETN